MATYNNHQQYQINGNGNIIGDNNFVNNFIKNYNGGSFNKGNTGEDAMGIGFMGVIAVLVIGWLFVRNAADIYFYLELGVIVSAVPSTVVATSAIFSSPSDNKQVVAAFFGIIMSAAAFLLVLYGQDRLEPQLIQFSQQARNVVEFWNRLSEYGWHTAVGSLGGAICIGVAAIFSFLMGVHASWHYLHEANAQGGLVPQCLNPFRLSRGGIFAVFFLVIAWAFESHLIFEIKF